eukprot:scaffold6545_cov68-Phaeocystis_antarctica.AAC.1
MLAWACQPRPAWPAVQRLRLAEEPKVGRCSALVRHLLLYTTQVRGGRACGRQDALRQRRDVLTLVETARPVCGRPASPPATRPVGRAVATHLRWRAPVILVEQGKPALGLARV